MGLHRRTRLHFAAPAAEIAMHDTELHEYEFAPDPFVPWPDAEGQWVAEDTVRPIAVRPVGDLVAAHAAAGVELRFDADLDDPARRGGGVGPPVLDRAVGGAGCDAGVTDR